MDAGTKGMMALAVGVIIAIAGIAAGLYLRTTGEGSSGKPVLQILTHNSFDIGADVVKAFEEENDVTLKFIAFGDAGSTLNMAIITKDNPIADLLYGIDNTFIGRALEEEIFIPYESPRLSKVPSEFIFDSTHHVTPVDYGYVALNFDKKYLTEIGLSPPETLDDLTGSDWHGRLVVENPHTSSTGLAFLLTTVAYFGEDDDYDYLDFWTDLKANGVLVVDGWSTAYYVSFTNYGGSRPVVVSYATSPAAESYFACTDEPCTFTDPPTGNVLANNTSFLQIEGIGILKGTDQEALAKKFIDFTLGEKFQEDFPTRMWVYPVIQDAQLPDVFEYAEEPAMPVSLDPDTINANREDWLDAWSLVMGT